MKRLCKHEKAALLLAVIAVLLMAISLCPGGWAEATSILQGLSTGLLSGMVLLLVAGIKGQETRELSDIYDFYYKSNNAFIAIMESYSSLYHMTYHGKKERMPFETYADLIVETYNKCDRAYQELYSLICSFGQKDYIAEDITLANTLKEKLSEIRQKIDNAKADGKNKALFNEVREMFYELQHEVYCFYPKSSQKMRQIYEKMKRIESSLL